MEMQNCPGWEKCSASLCPLDPELDLRVWWVDEEICRNRDHGDRRWIRKQRSIKRRLTKSWLDKAITFDMLFAASRPRQSSEEQRELMRQRIQAAREKKVDAIVHPIMNLTLQAKIAPIGVQASMRKAGCEIPVVEKQIQMAIWP